MDIRIRANRPANLTKEAKLIFEAENGHNYRFTIEEFLAFLLDTGTIVIQQPPAGVDDHGNLNNILGDGEYHISQAQLQWIRDNMYTAPSLLGGGTLSTHKVGDYIGFNGNLPQITITQPNNTTGILASNALNGCTTNTPSINIPSQTTNFNVSTINLNASTVTKNTPGTLQLINISINEQNNPNGNISHSISFNARFLHEVYVFLAEPLLGTSTIAKNYIEDIENNTASGYVNIYNDLRSNNYTASNLSISNPSGSDKYIYVVQPSTGNFVQPQINYGFGAVNFELISTFNYDFNDDGVSTTYNVYRADENSLTQLSVGSPINISLS